MARHDRMLLLPLLGAVGVFVVMLGVSAILLTAALVLADVVGLLGLPPGGVVLGLCVIAAIVMSSLAARGYYRALRRMTPPHPPGHCSHCGYNLTGNVSGVCPECGVEFK